MTSTKTHDAHDIPLAERVDYLTIIASMAGADVSLTPEEMDNLRGLCRALELPAKETQQILDTAHRPTKMVERHLDALKASPLRFTLISDCLALAYADGEYATSERAEIASLARALEIEDQQLAALEECARALGEAHAADQGDWKKRGEKLGQQLAAVGIPIGAVGALSAVGLSTAGISTGAAALVMGLGLASGLGAALGIGVGTVMGIRWLHARMAHPH
ncbi:MAG TPA: TerB family tellurite resistance protein [Polyangiaceae bacterium]|nr:TerB family tellurite resistance protein [Polyangiaceae bacterium]